MPESTEVSSCRLPETCCHPYGLPESHADTLPPERHRAAGKESGGTAHTERSGNTLRQMCPVTVRKTLSFSKNAEMHGKRVRIFTDSYDKRLSV